MRTTLPAAVCTLVLLSGLFGPVLSAADEAARIKAKAELNALADESGRLSRAFNLVHEVVAPSVVAIHTKIEAIDGQRTIFGGFIPNGQTREVEVGEGSGFVVKGEKENSYILTNAHVALRMDGREFVRDRQGRFVAYDRFVVELNDGRMVDAECVGAYADADLAVLKVAMSLPAADFADSDRAHVGDWVVALGYPLGVGYSASAGIVSATDRSTGIYQTQNMRGFESFIQTDAAINRGNSGGPLVNLRGQVLGVNASILSPTGTNLGLGFAIPANVARKVADDLITHGRVLRPVIGVTIERIERAPGSAQVAAVRIAGITPGSPADKAGLLIGDEVVQINGMAVDSDMQFRSRLLLSQIGTPITLALRRGEKTFDTEVAPIELDDLQKLIQASRPKTLDLAHFGLQIAADKQGLYLFALDQQWWKNDLRAGDRVLAIRLGNKTVPLKTLDQAAPLAKLHAAKLFIEQDGERFWITLREARAAE